MELKVKLSDWDAGLPVVMLNQETAKTIGVHTQEMVSIKTLSRVPKEISSVIDMNGRLRKDEILVSSEVRSRMGLKKGQKVDVNIASVTKSLIFIKKKLNGHRLSELEINEIVKDIVGNSLSEAEIALFVSGMCKEGMTGNEVIYMINAMLKYGNKMRIDKEFVVDKHSIGGVPGNRTTPIVVSICAAAGLTFPKTSSRAITSAAGTADAVESIARVDFSLDELKKILKETNAFMVWGGSLEMVPADSRILGVEKMLTIDPYSQMMASILSKKLAAGSKYILLDIPYGKNSKVTRKRAEKLEREFKKLAKHLHKKMRCVLTKGDEPIGNGIGPGLEMKDVIRVLDPGQSGPKDLEEKALFLAGNLLEMTGKAENNSGTEIARKILYSGKAFEKFKQIIKAQGGSLKRLKEAKFRKDIFPKKGGKIRSIDNKRIVSMARILGCPADKFSGIYLHHHAGEIVGKKDRLMTVYSETRDRLRKAVEFDREKPIVAVK
jgi:AMP phosphorylase